MSALTAISVGTAAYGAYSKYKQSKDNQGQMMDGGNILAPEDKWAEGSRKENYDRISGMMGNVDKGIDPLQNRRDQQLQHQLTGIRRDMFGTKGDRSQSISGMGQAQMALASSNPAAMAAQRKKDRVYMQTQMGDARQDIGDAGTNYLERMSMWGPEMQNKLKTGRETSGSYGPQFIPGADTGGGVDMDGIAGMAEQGMELYNKAKGGFQDWRGGRSGSGAMGREGPLLRSGQYDSPTQ
jgi:hypothetical protein